MEATTGRGYELTCGPTETVDEIDLPALRAKYAHERDRRLRDGQAQYIVTEGKFADFYETDPYMPVVPRAPIDADVDAVEIRKRDVGLALGAVGHGQAVPCVSNSTLCKASRADTPDQTTNWNAWK